MSESPKKLCFIVEDNRIYFENVVLESEGMQPWRPAIDAHEEEITFLENVFVAYNKMIEGLQQAEKVIEAQQKFITAYKTGARRAPDARYFDVLKEFRDNDKIKAALEAAGGDDE